jgi:hypothetical protein
MTKFKIGQPVYVFFRSAHPDGFVTREEHTVFNHNEKYITISVIDGNSVEIEANEVHSWED